MYINTSDNVNEALKDLKSGDRLIFRPGVHSCRLNIPIDNVYIEGEAGAIIDPASPLNNDWILATDSDDYCTLAGSNTWKIPLNNNAWMLLDANNEQLFRLDYHYCRTREPHNYYMTAFEAMIIPDGSRPGADYQADWWNGFEAMFVWDQQTRHLFVKYRDGRKPNNLRWSGGLNTHQDQPNPENSAIYMYGRNNISVDGLAVRGAFNGISIHASNDINVEACTFSSFDIGSRVQGQCNNVKIHDNYFNLNALGTNKFPPNSKISGENPYPESRLITYHVYAGYKFWHDRSDSTNGCGLSVRSDWSESTQQSLVPKNTEFSYNHVEHCTYAVDCFGGDGVDIHHNDVNNMIDMGFQRSDGGSRNIKIHDNEVHEAGYCLLRWHKPEQEAGKNYIYNNRCSDLTWVSEFVCMSGYTQGVPSNLEFWFYHNSLSGGNWAFTIVGVTEMPGLFVLNSIFSHSREASKEDIRVMKGMLDERTGEAPEAASLSRIGAIEYNYASSHLSGMSNTNRTGMPPVWDDSNYIERDFVLDADSPAKAAGIDISKPFVLNGIEYPALPGFSPGYFVGSAPDMGYISTSEVPPVTATLSVDTQQVIAGGEVNVSWTGSVDKSDWIGLYLEGETDPDNYLDWCYLNGDDAATIIVPDGTLPFVLSDVGVYEFRLYASNSFQLLAKTEPVDVVEDEPEPPDPEPSDERTFEVQFNGLMTVREVVSKGSLKKVDTKVKSSGKHSKKKKGKK